MFSDRQRMHFRVQRMWTDDVSIAWPLHRIFRVYRQRHLDTSYWILRIVCDREKIENKRYHCVRVWLRGTQNHVENDGRPAGVTPKISLQTHLNKASTDTLEKFIFYVLSPDALTVYVSKLFLVRSTALSVRYIFTHIFLRPFDPAYNINVAAITYWSVRQRHLWEFPLIKLRMMIVVNALHTKPCGGHVKRTSFSIFKHVERLSHQEYEQYCKY